MNPMQTRRILTAAGIALLLTSGCERGQVPAPLPAAADEVHDEGPPLTEFTLTDSQGREFHSKELGGTVWVASFFFTRCASNCRALNMQISQLQRAFGPRGLQVISISCDPRYDTPAVLAEYAQMYNAKPDEWRFLTGDMPYIKRVGDDMFDMPIVEKWHEDQLVVIDSEGKQRGQFHVRQPEQFERLQRLLDELLPGVPRDKDKPAVLAEEVD